MKELNTIQTRLNAPKGQYNKFGNYKFRSCEDILAAVKPLLQETECTLTISDDVICAGARVYIKATATIKNAKGDSVTTTAFAREEEAKKGMDASQVTGAASSYARKYALNGLFAIDDTKDADALNINKEYTQKSALEIAKQKIMNAMTTVELVEIYNSNKELQKESAFVDNLTARRKEIENAIS